MIVRFFARLVPPYALYDRVTLEYVWRVSNGFDV